MANRAASRGTTPRELANYLVSVRPILSAATDARRTWVRRIGVLMEDARKGSIPTIAASAGAIGRDHVAVFRAARGRLEGLRPPRGCEDCHRALGLWLDRLVQACDLLVDVGMRGDVGRIRETQSLLADGRAHAQAFNAEYARLIADLRQRVAQAKSRNSMSAGSRSDS